MKIKEQVLEVKNNIEQILKDSMEHQNKKIDFILINQETNETITIASDGVEEIIEFTPNTKNESNNYSSVAEWAYNFDEYLFQELENGYEIGYMSVDNHYGVWNSIEELYPEDINYKDGVQSYLQYCADNKIIKEYLDKQTGLDTPDIMKHFEGLALYEKMEYKGYIIEADDLNFDNPKENLVQIYDNEQDYINGEERETVSLITIGLRQNVKDYIDEYYMDNQKQNNNVDRPYLTFVLGYDLLNDMFRNSSMSECDVSYSFASNMIDKFVQTDEYKYGNKSVYELLEKWVDDNKSYIKSEYSKFIGTDIKLSENSIIESDHTNYYELDWDCPTEVDKKVYLAIKGEISDNPSFNISTSGVGYNWNIEENHTLKSITKSKFMEKARLETIVYFFDKDGRYNDLLNYPLDLQKQMDLLLLDNGYKPHGKVALKDQIKAVKSKIKYERESKKIEKNMKDER